MNLGVLTAKMKVDENQLKSERADPSDLTELGPPRPSYAQ